MAERRDAAPRARGSVGRGVDWLGYQETRITAQREALGSSFPPTVEAFAWGHLFGTWRSRGRQRRALARGRGCVSAGTGRSRLAAAPPVRIWAAEDELRAPGDTVIVAGRPAQMLGAETPNRCTELFHSYSSRELNFCQKGVVK